MARKLENYLKTHRRRAGLFQEEVAFLIGAKFDSSVSRHEGLGRRPTLETAIAYEVIFRTPVRTLFAGLFERVERETIDRARQLASRLQAGEAQPASSRKLSALGAVLASAREAEPRNP